MNRDERIDPMSHSFDLQAFATPRVLQKDLGDEAILLDLETETYFGLDPVGTRIWKSITAAPTIREAFTLLLDEFDVAPDDLERDMRALIDDLVARGLLRVGHA